MSGRIGGMANSLAQQNVVQDVHRFFEVRGKTEPMICWIATSFKHKLGYVQFHVMTPWIQDLMFKQAFFAPNI